MPDKIEMNLLLDYYGALLTDKQKEITRYYYRNDLSLNEIAELEGVSRAAIHDMLKRVEKEIIDYEKCLHIVENMKKRNKLYDKIEKETDNQKIHTYIKQCRKTEGSNYE